MMLEKDQNSGVTKSKSGMTCPDQCLSLQVRLPPRGGEYKHLTSSFLHSGHALQKKVCKKGAPPTLLK